MEKAKIESLKNYYTLSWTFALDSEEGYSKYWCREASGYILTLLEEVENLPEYEYAVQRSVEATGYLAPIQEHMWGSKETAERAIEFNQKMFPDKIVDYPEWIVKRRKAGRVEDA